MYESMIDKGITDNLPGRGGVYNSLNLGLYTYTHQNPLVLVDPDGNVPVFVIPLAFTVGGALLSAGGTAIGDIMRSGKITSGWQEYTGAFLGGGFTGGLLMIPGMNPLLVGAGGGFINEFTSQFLKHDFKIEDIALSSTIGGVLGLIPGGGELGVTLGRGSMSAVGKQMITKMKQGDIKNINAETFKKTIIGLTKEYSVFEQSLIKPYLDLGIQVTKEQDYIKINKQ